MDSDPISNGANANTKRKSNHLPESTSKRSRLDDDYELPTVYTPSNISSTGDLVDEFDQRRVIDASGGALQTLRPTQTPDDLLTGTTPTTPAGGLPTQIAEGVSPEQDDTTSSVVSGAENATPSNYNGDEDIHRSTSARWKRGVSKRMNAGRAFPGKETLCPYCEDLKLSFDKFVIDDRRFNGQRINSGPGFWGKRPMGTFGEISSRVNCPLCKMLLRAARDTSLNTTVSTDIHDVCRVFWTVDGRERVPRESIAGTNHESNKQRVDPSNPQQQRNLVRTVKRTRRLAIEWSHMSDLAYIVLVAPEGKFTVDGKINKGEWERPTLFLGRLLTGLEQTNWDKIKEWQQICRDHHTMDCFVPDELRQRFDMNLRQSPFFCVIDVKKMCLVSLPEDEDADVRYTALSYTWGEESRISSGHGPPKSETKKPRFKATIENHRTLMSENGIRNVQDSLPTSIQHAINLTEHLGIPYIWVDSLCIVQDSDESWELNADVMDVVYSNAELTICAADGDGDDEIGLKALFPPKRHTRHAEEDAIDYPAQPSPLKLLLSRPSESYIQRTRWNKRAWTFQERLLSRRSLIFVAGRVYFQCRSTTMSEDIYSEEAKAGWSVELAGAPAHTLNALSTNPVGVYKECLGMYTSRKLSYERDILAAFGGMANIIRSSLATNCNPLFGLPPSHFDYALLWEPEEQPTRRVVKGLEFPTWSWCGWKDKKICYKPATVSGIEINLHEWLLDHTWIAFYIRDGQGDLRLIWDPRTHNANVEIEERWTGYCSPQDGLPGGSKMKLEDEFSTFDYHGRPFNRSIPKRGRVEHSGKQFVRKYGQYMSHVKVLRPGEKHRILGPSNVPRPDKGILQFWTWSAEFYLGEEAVSEPFNNGEKVGNGLKRFAILDADGDFAGTCVISDEWSAAAREGRPQTFIALSDARDFDPSEYGCWSLYNEHQRDANPWQLYNVMMLCNKDGVEYQGREEEIAYRAGLGKVYKSAFDYGTNDENWKEIILG